MNHFFSTRKEEPKILSIQPRAHPKRAVTYILVQLVIRPSPLAPEEAAHMQRQLQHRDRSRTSEKNPDRAAKYARMRERGAQARHRERLGRNVPGFDFVYEHVTPVEVYKGAGVRCEWILGVGKWRGS